MNDLERARELVAAARAEFEPTHADRERMRRNLAGKLAGATIASSAAAKATAAVAQGSSALGGHTILGLGKLLVGTVLVTVGSGTALTLAVRSTASHGPERTATHAPVATRAPEAAVAPASTEHPAKPNMTTQPTPTAEPPRGEPVPPATPPLASRSKGALGSAASVKSPAPAVPLVEPRVASGGALEAELALLEQAKREETSGRIAAALATLGRLDREHSAGALMEEREALRVVIACKTRDGARAERAAAFHARYVHSVYGSRIDGACGPPRSDGSPAALPVTDGTGGGH